MHDTFLLERITRNLYYEYWENNESSWFFRVFEKLPNHINFVVDFVDKEIENAFDELKSFEIINVNKAENIKNIINEKKDIIKSCAKYQAIGGLLTHLNIATPIIAAWYAYDIYLGWKTNKDSKLHKFNTHPFTLAITPFGGSYGYIFSALAFLFTKEEKDLLKFAIYRSYLIYTNASSKERRIFNYAFKLFGEKSEQIYNINLSLFYLSQKN